jgi:hypothetical protein
MTRNPTHLDLTRSRWAAIRVFLHNVPLEVNPLLEKHAWRFILILSWWNQTLGPRSANEHSALRMKKRDNGISGMLKKPTTARWITCRG